MLTKRGQSTLSLCAKVKKAFIFLWLQKKSFINLHTQKNSALASFSNTLFTLEQQFDKQALMVGRDIEQKCTLVSSLKLKVLLDVVEHAVC